MIDYRRLKINLTIDLLLFGFIFGIFQALLAILFLEKGVSAANLGFVLGAYGVAVLVLEVPFGTLADNLGRVNTYRLSRLVLFIFTILFLFTSNFWLLLICSFGMGASHALYSGTVDAWFVEELKAQDNEDKVQELTGWLQGMMALGLAVGAIFGGYFPDLIGSFYGFSGAQLNMVAAAALIGFHLLLTFVLFPKEEKRFSTQDKKADFISTFKVGLKSFQQSKNLRNLTVIAVASGCLVSSLENYWQAGLLAIDQTAAYSTFGWITFGYFAMAILGPISIGMISASLNISSKTQVRIIPIVSALTLLGLAQTNQVSWFVPIYFAFMLFNSMVGPGSFTLLNQSTTDEVRSTVLSIYSMTFAVGGTVASFGLPFVIHHIGIPSAWVLSASISLFVFLFVSVLLEWEEDKAQD